MTLYKQLECGCLLRIENDNSTGLHLCKKHLPALWTNTYDVPQDFRDMFPHLFPPNIWIPDSLTDFDNAKIVDKETWDKSFEEEKSEE